MTIYPDTNKIALADKLVRKVLLEELRKPSDLKPSRPTGKFVRNLI